MKKRYLDIYSDGVLLYQGRWDELPLEEDVIIEMSIAFFRDSEPCYIHRDAVRVRLLSELEETLGYNFQDIPAQWLKRLTVCTGISHITHVEFSEK